MTPPIPPDAPRQRAGLACVACRTAKSKCLSQPLSSKCARCHRLDIVCAPASSNRLGRPRRLLKVNSPATGGNPPKQSPSSTTKPNDDDLNDGLSKGALVSCGTHQIEVSDAYGLYEILGLSPSPVTSLENPLGLPRLLTEYQLNVHPWLPLLPADPDALMSVLASAPPILLNAIQQLTFPDEAELFVPEVRPDLPNIQAGIMHVYIFYGRGDSKSARALLRIVSQCIVDLRWHLIDADCASSPAVVDDLEPMRRAWWECWFLEVTLAAVYGEREFILSTQTFHVRIPCETSSGEELSSLDSPTALRIRALSLLHDCSEPGNQLPLNPSRLASLACIANNTITLAYQLWMDLGTKASQTCTARDAAMRETALMACVGACSAIIYLYTTSYASCVFVCGIDLTKVPPPDALTPIREASERIFTLLRDSLNNRFLNTNHSPFFACIMLVAVRGCLLSNAKDIACNPWTRAAVASNMELAELATRKQGLRYPAALVKADEIQRLSYGFRANLDENSMKMMLGINC